METKITEFTLKCALIRKHNYKTQTTGNPSSQLLLNSFLSAGLISTEIFLANCLGAHLNTGLVSGRWHLLWLSLRA